VEKAGKRWGERRGRGNIKQIKEDIKGFIFKVRGGVKGWGNGGGGIKSVLEKSTMSRSRGKKKGGDSGVRKFGHMKNRELVGENNFEIGHKLTCGENHGEKRVSRQKIFWDKGGGGGGGKR